MKTINMGYSMFNLSRIPLPNCDAFSTPSPLSTHLSLLVDDYYYAIDIFSPPSSSADGAPEPLPAGEIEKRFQAAVNDAKQRKERGERAVEIGVLSADDRDNWTKVGCAILNPIANDCALTWYAILEPRAYLTPLAFEPLYPDFPLNIASCPFT